MRDEPKFLGFLVHSSSVSIILSMEHWIYKGQEQKQRCSQVKDTKIVILTCLSSGRIENDDLHSRLHLTWPWIV